MKTGKWLSLLLILSMVLSLMPVSAFAEEADSGSDVPSHEHSYTSVVTEPTCEEQGYTTYSCECGESYKDEYTNPLGHSWDDGIVTLEPTTDAEGEMTYTCARCGATKTGTIEKLPEEPVESGEAGAGEPEFGGSESEEPEFEEPASVQNDSGSADLLLREDGTVPVTIVDDTTGNFPLHGTVQLPDYTYYSTSEIKYYVSRGDTITVEVIPDTDYICSDLRVTYKRTEAGSDLELELDDTNSFLLPVRGAVSVTIHATFASTLSDYGIRTYVNDGDTGNTVTADRERACAGETVSLTVNMNPGTRFNTTGLLAFNADDDSMKVELTQTDSSTYTFVMPSYDVMVYAVFERISYDVENLLEDTSFEELRFELTVDKTENLHYGDTVTVTTMTFASLLKINPVAYYEKDGGPVYITLTKTREYPDNTAYYQEFTFAMPENDVNITADYAYEGCYRVSRVVLDTDGNPVEKDKPILSCAYQNGDSLSKNNNYARPGDELTFEAAAYGVSPDCGVREVYYTWEKDGETHEGTFTSLTYTTLAGAEGSFVMPEGDVTFYIVKDRAYYVNIGSNGHGNLIYDWYKAFPGTEITVKAEVTDEAFHNIIWMIDPEDLEVTISGDDQNIRTFTMPARVVNVRVDFTMTPIPYLSRSWNGHEIIEKRDYCRIYSYLSGNTTDSTVTLTNGWYIVDGEVIFGSGTKLVIDEYADVNLLLMDGATLKANNGIYIKRNGYSSLTIWAQENETGKLIAKSGSGAAIGGITDEIGGKLIINGGIIEATGTNGSAGIGNGRRNSGMADIEINGGTVTAIGGEGAAGIGSAPNSRLTPDITINGGDVTAESAKGGGAAIGGGLGCSNGVITINGGTVDALAYQRSGGISEEEDEYLGGAGIGSGRNADQQAPIKIHGGDVTAKGGVCAAGIGGGRHGNGGPISIKSSVVTATNGYSGRFGGGAAIGGGSGGTNGDIVIESGNIYAYATNAYYHDHEVFAAGIGAGHSRDQGGSILIYGGSVYAECDGYGAAIGGSSSNDGGRVYIADAVVTAVSLYGAGIGGGGVHSRSDDLGGSGGNVTIDSGLVIANSRYKSAGIGGGNKGNGGTVTINGGYVCAVGGQLHYSYLANEGWFGMYVPHVDPKYGLPGNKTILSDTYVILATLAMNWLVSDDYGGAGIGGGNGGNGGTVTINGGHVTAQSGLNTASAIGRGNGGSADGNLTIYKRAKVAYGTLKYTSIVSNHDESREVESEGFTVAEKRALVCHNNAFVEIEPCDHQEISYTVTEDKHEKHCKYCSTVFTAEQHAMDEQNHCTVCGYEGMLCNINFASGDDLASGTMDPLTVVPDSVYSLPECTFSAPEGKSFSGWSVVIGDAEAIRKAPGDTITVSADTTITALWVGPPEFKVQSLLLSGQIGVNFFMDLPEIYGVDYADSFMEFTVSGKGGFTKKAEFDANNKNTTGKYYGFTCYVNSIQMAETITAVFHYGDGLTVEKTYSVKEYLEALNSMADSFDETTMALIHALADYGHYVQPFLSDANGWTIGTDYAEMDEYYTGSYTISDVTSAVADYAISRENSDPDIGKITYTLVLDSGTDIRVYFKPASGYRGSFAVEVDGSTWDAVKQSDGRYLVTIPGISAHLLGTPHTIVATTDAGNTTIRVSALSYLQTMLSAYTDSKYQNAAASIYYYFLAAQAYKANH